MKIGYARVSSNGQNLQSQLDSLEGFGCDKIFQEKMSGKQQDNRLELQAAIDYCREGDIFVVTRLDRCSRSVKDLHIIIDLLTHKGVSLKATEQELDTSSSSGRLMIGLLSIVSAFETDLRAERQADGIKSAKANGIKFGAKRKLTEQQVIEAIDLNSKGIIYKEIADNCGVHRSTLLRYIAEYKEKTY